MAFDIETFDAVMTGMAEATYAFAEGWELPAKTPSLARAGMTTSSRDDAGFFVLWGKDPNSRSNHRNLAHRAFLSERNRDMEKLKDIFLAFPAFDHERFQFTIDLYPRKKAMPAVKMSVMGTAVSAGPVRIETLSSRIAHALSLVEGLPRPRGRLFQVNLRTIPGADPQSAIRAYLALLSFRDPCIPMIAPENLGKHIAVKEISA